MEYTSTRSGAARVTAAEAICQGISPEGGLFLPRELPQISLDDVARLRGQTYAARAEFILSKFFTPAGGWAAEDLRACVRGAYGENFSCAAVAPLKKLDGSTSVLELFHGPTSAFKDLALQLLPRLLTFAAKTQLPGKEIVILVATSGDTGKAALEGFADVPGTRIVVYYPAEGVSAVQQRQMAAQQGANVNVVAVRGNFDDTQTGVKQIFTDPAIQARLARQNRVFSSANSINWGRLAPQIVYYFSAYCDLLNAGSLAPGQSVHFAVPTGNFGNILAGYYAKAMGLPIDRLLCASNRNRVLTDFLADGVYNRNRPFYLTSSPSMDILISSNLERLLWLAGGQNSDEIVRWMQALSATGQYKIPGELLAKLQDSIVGLCCDEAQCGAAIRFAWENQGYLSDTHTACALHALTEYRAKTGDATPCVVVATASPYKFAGSVLPALGLPAPADEFAALAQLEAHTGVPCPAPLQGLQQRPVRFTQVCSADEMAAYI